MLATRPPTSAPPSTAATSSGPAACLPTLVGRDPSGLDASERGPGRGRVGGREHRRRRRGAGVLGRRPGCPRRAGPPGRQHPRRHGRPPLAPLRPLRLGRGPPRRRRRLGAGPAHRRRRGGRPAPLGRRGVAGRARRRAAHPSPNAGVAEAAFAAALGVRLGGVNRYGDRVEARPELGDGPAPTAGRHRRRHPPGPRRRPGRAAALAVARRSVVRVAGRRKHRR